MAKGTIKNTGRRRHNAEEIPPSDKKSVGRTQRRGNETNKSDGLYTTRWDTKCDKGTIGTSHANFLGRKGCHTPRSRLTLRQRERTTTPKNQKSGSFAGHRRIERNNNSNEKWEGRAGHSTRITQINCGY